MDFLEGSSELFESTGVLPRELQVEERALEFDEALDVVGLVFLNEDLNDLMAPQLLVERLQHDLSAPHHYVPFDYLATDDSEFVPLRCVFYDSVPFEDVLARQIALDHI